MHRHSQEDGCQQIDRLTTRSKSKTINRFSQKMVIMKINYEIQNFCERYIEKIQLHAPKSPLMAGFCDNNFQPYDERR